jgi:chemotaxis protein MotB
MNKRHSGLFIVSTLIFLMVLMPSLSIYAGGGKALRAKLKQCDEKNAQLEVQLSDLKSENASLSNQISRLNSEKSELQGRIAELEKQIEAKDAEIALLQQELAQAPDPMIVSKTVQEVQQKEAEIIDLKMERDELQSEVRDRDSEIARLNRDIAQLNRDIAQLKSDNLAMQSKNDALARENSSLSGKNQELVKKNDELYGALEMYEGIEREGLELMDVIYARLKEALRAEIASGEVNVYKATLGVVVDISSSYMFDVGSIVINPKGKNVLTKVGALLQELGGNYFIGVLGNADSKPIVTPALKKRFPTNWELSAARGATVTRYLIDVSRISADRFISMGLGKEQPIATNQTTAGRGRNRRIDIALLPIDVLSAVVVGAQIE